MLETDQIKRMRLEILEDENNLSKDNIFKKKLEDAEVLALQTRYPYENIDKIPLNNKKLKNWQVRCAIELYNRLGSSNVSSYKENGISVEYITGLLSKDLVNEITPKCGTIK